MRSLLTAAAGVLPPVLFARVHRFAKLHYWPDLRNLQTFTDLLLATRIFDRTQLMPLAADKFTLREYAAEGVGDDYLPQLYRVALTLDDIELSGLPLIIL